MKNVINSWGAGTYEVETGEHLHEATLLQLDIDKAVTHLNWKPQYPLRQAVQESVAWYKAFYAGQDVVNVSLQQLDAYVSNVLNLYSQPPMR